MKRRAGVVLLILALAFVCSAYADSSWECEKCGRRVPVSLGNVCPFCGTQRHIHTWRPATCTEPKTCTKCGATEGDALGHRWDEGAVIQEATCQTIGAKSYTCTVCKITREETSAKDPENHVGGTELRSRVEATCTEDGYTGDVYCLGCGELISEGTEIAATGHQWDQGTVLLEATCRMIGAKTYTCTVCGETRDEVVPKNPDNHTGGTEIKLRLEATCTADGYTGDVYCKGCGKLLSSGSAVAAFGHQWDAGTVIQEATCRTIGVTRYTCTLCGAAREEKSGKNPENHSGGTEVESRVDATCASDGYTGNVYCKGCGNLISIGETIPALGHHWDGGTVVRAANCRERGVTRYFCERCGATREDESPKNPDRHEGGKEVRSRVDATCTESGYTGDTYCADCGALISRGTAVAALGHQWTDATYSSPKTCSRCGATEGKPLRLPVSVGDTITFGRYPQASSGTEKSPIEWMVLDMRGNRALLLSKYGLDAKPYHTKLVSITWEECSLREWLNGPFLNAAFTADEQSGIVRTEVDNGKSQGYSGFGTKGGADTRDLIFLLSYAEANEYLGVGWDNTGNKKGRVAPTAYAKAAGASVKAENKTTEGKSAGWWWLRSPGSKQSHAIYVNTGGCIRYNRSGYVTHDSGCVRPALWVDLDSGLF